MSQDIVLELAYGRLKEYEMTNREIESFLRVHGLDFEESDIPTYIRNRQLAISQYGNKNN